MNTLENVYSLDDPAIDAAVLAVEDESKLKICAACNKTFIAKGRNAQRMKYCGREHFVQCQNCGAKIKISSFNGTIPQSCSRKCANALRVQSLQQSMKAKYGVSNPSQKKEFVDKANQSRKAKSVETAAKRRQTMVERYGVEYPVQSAELRQKTEHTNLDRYGCVNAASNDKIKQKISKAVSSDVAQRKYRQTSLDHYGVEHPAQSAEIQAKIRRTCVERYGEEYPTQNSGIRSKIIATNLQKYGVQTYFQSEDFKEKAKTTNLERYGTLNPMQNSTIKQQAARTREQTNLARYGAKHIQQALSIREQTYRTNEQRYGVPYYTQTTEFKEKSKETIRFRYGVNHYSQTTEFQDRYQQTCQRHFETNNPMQNREVHLKATQARSKCVANDGTKLDSQYEVDFYNFLQALETTPKLIKRNIPVTVSTDASHTTFIDFQVDDLLFEVKGGHLLRGCYDYALPIAIEKKLDTYRKNHVIVITDSSARELFGRPNSAQSNGLKYPHKCPNPLIGVDIELFRNPSFPYREDRPKCFYDVSVNGKMSAFEAFNDINMRWKMILNRIQYSGGFIDANQVLTALNVSRTCKQPSWFSKTLAKHIISTYCTSNIIVDPFAGWGTRCDAAFELNKTYIGCDLNEELVVWHQQHNRNITLGDAKEFKYDKECSVFICPPYQNVELYLSTQDCTLTQCEWLKIVMDNVPCAKEYVMVCKVVDSGWEQYIVATKVNKSHFGQNNEYVLVVHNNM